MFCLFLIKPQSTGALYYSILNSLTHSLLQFRYAHDGIHIYYK